MPASDVGNSGRAHFLREFHFVSESSRVFGIIMCHQQGRVYLGQLEPNKMCIELIEHDLGSVILLERKQETTPWQIYTSFLIRESSSMWTQSGAVCFARHIQYGSSVVMTWWEELEEEISCVCVCPYPCHTSYEHCSTLSQRLMYSCHLSIIMSTNQECICSNQAESSAYCSFQKGRWDTIFILPMPSI